MIIAPDGAPTIRGAPVIRRVAEFQIPPSHKMDDDGVAQLAVHVNITIVIEIGAADLPDHSLAVILDEDGDTGGALVLGHVDAAAGAFFKEAGSFCDVLGGDCDGEGEGDEGDEMEN